MVTSLTKDWSASSLGFNSDGSLSNTSLTSFTASVILIPCSCEILSLRSTFTNFSVV